MTEAEIAPLSERLWHEAAVPRIVDKLAEPPLTVGQRAADHVAHHMGSWRFIVIQASALLVWIVLNSLAWRNDWDPYPFILLNLVLSFQAAFAAPVIMMSQNRQAARDRLVAAQDFAVDRHADEEVAAIHARLDRLSGRQWDALVALQREQLELLRRIDEIGREIHKATAQNQGSSGTS